MLQHAMFRSTSSRPLAQLIALAALLLLCSAGAQAQDSEATLPPPTAPKPTASVSLFADVQYKEDGTFSDAARAECPLDTQVVDNLSKIAGRYQLSLKLSNEKNTQNDGENMLFLRIDHILGGRPGNGFGGRWVISELGVTSILGDPANPKKSKYHFCSAGLGANPFANFGACQRLQRCTEQISTKIAAWLRQELLPKAALAKVGSVAPLADSDKQSAEDKP